MPEIPILDWFQGNEISDTDSSNYFLINRHGMKHFWGLEKKKTKVLLKFFEPFQYKVLLNY